MKALLLIFVVVIAGLLMLGIQGTLNKVQAHTAHANEIINSIN